MNWSKGKKDVLSPGDTFEKYRVEKLLGRGGMGAVYLVHHNVLESSFALKVLFPEIATKNKQFIDRFIREAKLACKIKHPNLIAVYDAGKNPSNGMYYLVMEYIAGISLREQLKRDRAIAPTRAVTIITQVALALEAAHKNNMVHRDIKPDNIMFTVDGTVKLADLGIAKSTNEQDTMLTVESSVFGTPAYMSPEQARDSRKVDCRADIYSLGIVFYEMLAGERPYQGESMIEILSQVVRDENIPDIRTICPAITGELAELVAAMTAKDLQQRIQSPCELLKRLSLLPVQPETPVSAVLPQSSSPLPPDVTQPTLLKKQSTALSASDVTIPTLINNANATPIASSKTKVLTQEAKAEPIAKKSIPVKRIVMLGLISFCSLLLIVFSLIMFTGKARTDTPSTFGETRPVQQAVNVITPPVPPPKPAPKTTVSVPAAPEPDPLVENAVILLGVKSAASESLKNSLAGRTGKSPVITLEAEVFSQYRNQLKEIIKSKPVFMILDLSSRYAELDLSKSNFELLIRDEANLLKDSHVPFAFMTGNSTSESSKTETFNAAIRELCKLRSYHLIDSNSKDFDNQLHSILLVVSNPQ